ncbi:MAG: hypothetical protein ACFFEJ_12465 [Candidatus Thorarchaeota archaeon]
MKRIVEWMCILTFVVVFSLFIVWIIPDKAYLLVASYFALAITLLVSKATKFDEKKDERTIQLFRLGASNAFVFMILVMPFLALFIQLGLIVIEAPLLLFILFIAMIAISWITVGYHYWK